MSGKSDTLRVLEGRRAEILQELRKADHDMVDELETLNALIERYKGAGSEAESDPAFSIPLNSLEWNDAKKYPKPRHVIRAILEKHGGSYPKKQIAEEGARGGWRLGGDSPKYDILSGIDYILTKKNPWLREDADGIIHLIQGEISD